MARSHFGGTSVDWLLKPYRFGGTTLLALKTGTTVLDFYSAETGGTHYTDLLDEDGAAVTRVEVTDYQIPSFQGPDGILAMWADKGDGSPREYIEAQDLAAAAAAVAAAVAATAGIGPTLAPNGTDDTSALLSAITAAAGKEIKLTPGGVYKISGTVPGANINGQGATVQVIANVNAFTITPTSQLANLNVVATVAGYSSTLLKINDKAGFSVLATTRLTNLILQGYSVAAGGIAIGADDGGTAGIVAFIKGNAIDIRYIGTGIRLKNTHASSWFNGNEFTKVAMYDVATPVVVEGICDSNVFRGQIQYTASTTLGVKCSGNSNILDLLLWDASSYPAAGTYDLTGGSYNKLTTPTTAAQLATITGANPSNEVNDVTKNGLVLVRPKDRSQYITRSGSTINTLENYLGEQDNFLKMAHKTYTVTTSTGTSTGAFDFTASPASWVMAALDSITITIDATASPLSSIHVLGVLFPFTSTSWPDTLKIETENVSAVKTTQLDLTSVSSPLQYTRAQISGTVYKIYVTFTVATAKTVRISRIFGSSGNIEQKSFLTTNGGTAYGPLVMSATYVRHGNYTTAGRPSASTAGAGAEIYDTTLSKPVFSNGTIWKSASDREINVNDYGVSTAGSGAANLTAFQAALAATPAGGTAFVPAGTYAITGDLAVSASLVLRGAGDGTVLSFTNGGLLFDGNAGYLTELGLHDLRISRAGTAGAALRFKGGGSGTGAVHFNVSNVRVVGSTGECLLVDGSYIGTFTGCYFIAGVTGIKMDLNGGTPVVSGNNISFHGGETQGCGTAVKLTRTYAVEFYGHCFEGSTSGGVDVTDDAYATGFYGCYWEGNATYDLRIGNTTTTTGPVGLIVHGGFFEDGAGAKTNSIIAIRGLGIDIRGNAFFNYGADPIKILEASAGVVQGQARDNTHNGSSANTTIAYNAATKFNTTIIGQAEAAATVAGTPLTLHKQYTITYDHPSIAANTAADLTGTATGVAVGDDISWHSNGLEAGLVAYAWVSATNTITLRLGNVTTAAIDPVARNWRFRVWR